MTIACSLLFFFSFAFIQYLFGGVLRENEKEKEKEKEKDRERERQKKRESESA
jgi:hypothetical protein